MKQDRSSVRENASVPGTKAIRKWSRRVLESKRQAVIKSDDMKFKAEILVGKLVVDDSLWDVHILWWFLLPEQTISGCEIPQCHLKENAIP